MGLFKKKPDPVSERARALNDQIAELESQIKKLAAEETRPTPLSPAAPATRVTASSPAPPRTQPRLRSTARPHGPTVLANPFTDAPGTAPVIEEADQQRLHAESEPGTAGHYNDLGMRKYDLAAAWQRWKNHFSGPPTSNPKLVNYLAAGSVQGLRPLRYEKRVARNRFLLFLGILIAVLWGLAVIIFGRR